MNNLLNRLLEKGYNKEQILNILLNNLVLDSVECNVDLDKTINYHIKVTKYADRPNDAYCMPKFEKESFKLFEDIVELYFEELNNGIR